MAVTSRPLIVCIALLAGALAASSVAEAQAAFPYDREFRLDVKPMRGSKRIPGLEIGANGDATIDLWCNSVQAKLVVAADTITILTAPPPEMSCPPERARGDEELLATLNEVTNWRMEGEFLVFTGGKSLRFRLNTN